jgi:tetratricopeptide (TPR) repeat protein
VRYRAFISYSHGDAHWAAWLHRALEGYRVPRRLRDGPGGDATLPERLAPVFRDREELGSAHALGPQIEAALADSEALIVLCSPAAAQSRWVGQEIVAFKRTRPGAHVLALIVAGEPHAGDARECFPDALRFELEADGSLSSRPAEPLAADVRPGKDGKSLALCKIVSGLLGVGLDALRQREAQRRHQRMLAVTALAVAVMLVTSFLGVQAMIARQAAERRQKQAEALVSFMLGDLNDKLSQVSRLDILETVHQHAMDYFRSLPQTDVTDQALEQRAKAMVNIGNVRRDQGHLPAALESYRLAEAIAARLARSGPRNLQRQLAYADVLAYIGTTHWYAGDLDKAQAGFDATLAVLEHARTLAPRDARLLFQLATAENNTGHVAEGRGQFDLAESYYRRMLAISRQLVVLDPKGIDAQNELGLAHNNLAKMALLRGDVATAVTEYRADVAIEAALARADPQNNAQAERLLISQATLGRTLALAGDLAGGTAALRGAVASARDLRKVDATATSFQEDVGLYSTQLARLLRLQGDAAGAAALTDEALVVMRGLVKKDPTHSGWQRELAEALIEQGEQALATGRAADAGPGLREAIAILEPQRASQPDDRGALLLAANAALRLADAGVPAVEARQLRTRALQVVDAQKNARADPRLLALRADALLALGDRAGAAAVCRSLLAGHYRDAAFVAMTRRAGVRATAPG